MKTSFVPRLTTGVHTDSAGGGGSRRRGPFFGEPVIFDRLFPRDRRGLWRGLCCLAVLTVAVGAVVLVLAFGGTRGAGEGKPPEGDGGLPGGLPSAGTQGLGTGPAETVPADRPTREPDTDPHEPSEDTEPIGTEGSDDTPVTDGQGDPESLPADSEPATAEPSQPGIQPGTEPGTEPPAEPDTHPDGDGEPESQPQPAPPTLPEGCYPIVPTDMSQTDRGAGYIVGDLTAIPDTLPRDGLWGTEGPPTVLIINTRPYEGYGDGKAWYDPETGALALTDTPNASDGVVALGASLARSLRGMGVTVIHLRIAVSEEDSAADIYTRTETVVRSYCRLYPDIGLVLDLRRSAELTEDGSILRTAGSLEGQSCAQVRISVNGGRDAAVLGRDLAVAVALREGLWDIEPTVSRPVRVKEGEGLAGDLAGVCMLTLEMGSAGNTYAEAEGLAAPAAAVLGDLILNSGG